MPLAFGTILGGMTTMIGTPPNLIVSGFRAQSGGGGFAMFDFTPVGLAVAVAGVVFVALIGWRLVPARKRHGTADFETGAYLTEARVPPKSKAAGMTLRDIEAELDEGDAQVVGLVRHGVRVNAPHAGRKILADDILVIEAEVDALAGALSALGLELEEAGPSSDKDEARKDKTEGAPESGRSSRSGAAGSASEDEAEAKEDAGPPSDEIVLMELVVRPESAVVGRSAKELLLRTRYGINLLALSREGIRSKSRLRMLRIQPGDLLLMQAPPDVLAEFAADYGCVPLARRDLRIPDKRKAITASAIMAFAVGGAAFGLLPAAISFALGVLASMALRTVPPRAVYDSIDWPVIVLLGALIPVAGAMEATGTADLIAAFLLDRVAQGHAIVGLVLVLVVTMFLSDLMNNAATAAVMCPIAIGTASALGVSADRCILRLSDTDRASEQHPDPRAGWIPLRRLLAPRSSSRGTGSCHQRADAADRVAAVTRTRS